MDGNPMFKNLSTLFILGLFSLNACAFSSGKSFTILEEVLESFEHSLHVKILSSEVLEFSVQGAVYDCGTVYRARVLDSIGENDLDGLVTFSSSYSLKSNTDYVVFLTSRPQLIRAISQDKDKAVGHLASQQMAECTNRLPKYNTDGSGTAFEFETLQNRKTSALIYSDPTVLLPKSLLTKGRKFNLCDISASKDEQCNEIYIYRVFEWADLKKEVANP